MLRSANCAFPFASVIRASVPLRTPRAFGSRPTPSAAFTPMLIVTETPATPIPRASSACTTTAGAIAAPTGVALGWTVNLTAAAAGGLELVGYPGTTHAHQGARQATVRKTCSSARLLRHFMQAASPATRIFESQAVHDPDLARAEERPAVFQP